LPTKPGAALFIEDLSVLLQRRGYLGSPTKTAHRSFLNFTCETLTNPETNEQEKVAHYRPFEQGEDGKVYEGQVKSMPIKGSLDLKVNTGSTLSFAKDAIKNEAIQLFDRQIIDDEEVLKRFDYPNWEAVLQRVNEKKAAQAESQAASQTPA
jgi:hypothetical protein